MIPIVRTLINIPAGLARMPYGKFALYTLIGSYIWCTLLVGAGYLLGHEWWRISGIVKQTAPWALLVGLIIWIAVNFLQRSRQTKRKLSC